VIIRPARAEELQTAEELVACSNNDLTERHGFGRIAAARPADFQLFSTIPMDCGWRKPTLNSRASPSAGPAEVSSFSRSRSCRSPIKGAEMH
jgi:hypothetical protein